MDNLARMVNANASSPDDAMSQKEREKLLKKHDRRKYLLEEASKFMNKRELELFRHRILEPKPKEKKEKPESTQFGT